MHEATISVVPARPPHAAPADPAAARRALHEVLGTMPARVIACSGGIDSLLLATVAHRLDASATVVAHAVSPAVPAEATRRVHERAAVEGWNLRLVTSGEFRSEDYLSNPVDRCYHCKSNLYTSLDQLAGIAEAGATMVSGANLDDLGEYRPGLVAASENAVRHPYVEAGIDKAAIRAIARELGLPFAELPASPCLASRLYTGTRVTPQRLRAVEAGELLVRERTGIAVVRCRLREDEMLVEVGDGDRRLITPELLEALAAVARGHEPGIASVALDAQAYRPGRSFVGAP